MKTLMVIAALMLSSAHGMACDNKDGKSACSCGKSCSESGEGKTCSDKGCACGHKKATDKK